MQSSLTWFGVLVVAAIIAVIAGVFAPFVSKKDKQIAEAFLVSRSKKEVPTIVIQARPHFGYTIILLLGCVIAAVILYFKTSFAAAALAVGLGITGEILIVIAVVFLAACVFSVLLVILLVAAYITGEDLSRYYQRHYGVNVKILE